MRAFFWVFMVFAPGQAFAYIGPGAGITLLGSVLGLSSMVMLGTVCTVLWPIWFVYKWYKRRAGLKDGTDKP